MAGPSAQPSVLLISDRGDDEEFVRLVAETAKAQVVRFDTTKEAVASMDSQSHLGIFVDVTDVELLRGFEAEVQEQLGVFSEKADPNLIHFMSDTELSENRDLIVSPLFSNFFRRPANQVEDFAKTYGRYLAAGAKVATHNLQNFLDGRGKVQKIVLNNTQQKQEAVEAVRQYLISAKIPPRIANLIANSTDELLMNAMFDAPCDEFGRPLYSTTDRNDARALSQQEQVTMSLGFDGVNVGVSVSDSFGSVDRNKMLSHLAESYKRKAYQIKTGSAGAGLGIATIFSSGGSLIYHVETKVKTEATLLYRTYSNFRAFKQQFKFFSARFFG